MSTILIVENNHDHATIFEMLMKRSGHTVLRATDGPSGLAAAHIQPIDLMLVDYMLPGQMTGEDFCRAVRAIPRLADAAIIMLSASAHRSDLASGLAAGADAYLLKPFDNADLRALVVSLLDPNAPRATAHRPGDEHRLQPRHPSNRLMRIGRS
jgi:DNA-binding response OmpR family regulator